MTMTFYELVHNVPCLALEKKQILECAPMPNVMAALPNIGGALCSMPLLECRAVTLPRRETR